MLGNMSCTLWCRVGKSHEDRLYLPEVILHEAFLIPKPWEMTQLAGTPVPLPCHNPAQQAHRTALCRGMQERAAVPLHLMYMEHGQNCKEAKIQGLHARFNKAAKLQGKTLAFFEDWYSHESMMSCMLGCNLEGCTVTRRAMSLLLPSLDRAKKKSKGYPDCGAANRTYSEQWMPLGCASCCRHLKNKHIDIDLGALLFFEPVWTCCSWGAAMQTNSSIFNLLLIIQPHKDGTSTAMCVNWATGQS